MFSELQHGVLTEASVRSHLQQDHTVVGLRDGGTVSHRLSRGGEGVSWRNGIREPPRTDGGVRISDMMSFLESCDEVYAVTEWDEEGEQPLNMVTLNVQ